MILILPFVLLTAWLLKGKKMQDTCFIFLKLWARIFSILCFFSVQVKGKELINLRRAHIYISNHNSYLDTVVATLAIPESWKPLGKIEMVKTPIFGLIYRKVVVLIDRKSSESRAKCIQDLKNELREGQSILIFPEGTMNRTDAPLTHFYDGAFRLAIETQTPIAPFIILNTRCLFPRNNPLDIQPGTLHAIFAEPIAVDGLIEADLPALKAKVYEVMEHLILKSTAQS